MGFLVVAMVEAVTEEVVAVVDSLVFLRDLYHNPMLLSLLVAVVVHGDITLVRIGPLQIENEQGYLAIQMILFLATNSTEEETAS